MDQHRSPIEIPVIAESSSRKRPAVLQLDVIWNFHHKESGNILLPTITKKITAYAVTAHCLVTARRNFCMPTSVSVGTSSIATLTNTAAVAAPKPEVDFQHCSRKTKQEETKRIEKFAKRGNWQVEAILWDQQTHSPTSQTDGKIMSSEYSVVKLYFEEHDLILLSSSHVHHRVQLAFPDIMEISCDRSRHYNGITYSDPTAAACIKDKSTLKTALRGTWIDRLNGTGTVTFQDKSLAKGSPIFVQIQDETEAMNSQVVVIGTVSKCLGKWNNMDIFISNFTSSSVTILLLYSIYGINVRRELKGGNIPEPSHIPLLSVPRLQNADSPNYRFKKYIRGHSYVEKELDDENPRDLFRRAK